MTEYFQRHPDLWEEYNRTIRDRGFSYGIQKERLLVRLKPDATRYEIDMVASGLTFARALSL